MNSCEADNELNRQSVLFAQNALACEPHLHISHFVDAQFESTYCLAQMMRCIQLISSVAKRCSG